MPKGTSNDKACCKDGRSTGFALAETALGESAAFGRRATKRGALGPVKPTGGRLGLPADFLIAPDGRISALKYGHHAFDQWTVEELLDHRARA